MTNSNQSEHVSVDVVVVGGAMSGLATAAALTSAGLSVAIIDRADPRDAEVARNDVRTTAISLSSRRMLTVLGAWQGVADTAEPILDIRISDADSRAHMHYDHAEVGDDPMGHIVDNSKLKTSLLGVLECNPGEVSFLAPATVADLQVGPASAKILLEDGRSVSAPLVVAADGRRSTIRDLAGLRVHELPYHQTSIVETIAHEKPHRNVAHERFLPGGPLALLPLNGQRSALVWTERTSLAKRIAALDDDAFAVALQERFGDSLGKLRPVGPRRSYPLSLTVAEKFIADRVALVGDAAHAIHPIAGQGFNLGLRDVAALAEVVADAVRLGQDPGSAIVLEQYQRRRRFDAMSLIGFTDGLNRLFSNDIAPIRRLRGLGLAITRRIGPLKRAAVRHAMGTLGTLPRLLRGEAL